MPKTNSFQFCCIHNSTFQANAQSAQCALRCVIAFGTNISFYIVISIGVFLYLITFVRVCVACYQPTNKFVNNAQCEREINGCFNCVYISVVNGQCICDYINKDPQQIENRFTFEVRVHSVENRNAKLF